jgi:hypothetical protein
MYVNAASCQVTSAWVVLPMLCQRKMIAGSCEGEEERAPTILLVVLGTIWRLRQNIDEILSMLRTVSRAFPLCRQERLFQCEVSDKALIFAAEISSASFSRKHNLAGSIALWA